MTGTWLSRTGEAILQCLFPPACLFCGEALFGHAPATLCPDCYDAMDWIGDEACRFCGYPAGEYADPGKGCGQCRPDALRFTRAAAVVRYGTAARELVHAFKFDGARSLAAPLGEMMAARVRSARFPDRLDMVMPVPLHPRRLRERGYDQAGLLAANLARALDLPLRESGLERVRYTEAQALLRHAERVTNPVGAFRCADDLAGARVLLVDDVVTTGSTVGECAAVLRKAGASRIYVIAFAR